MGNVPGRNEGEGIINEEVTANQIILKITTGIDVPTLTQALLMDRRFINSYSGEMTPLHFATLSDNAACVRVLLRFGADPSLTVTEGLWGEKTALEIAEECGFDEITAALTVDLDALREEGQHAIEEREMLLEAETRMRMEEEEKEKEALGLAGLDGTPLEIAQRMINEAVEPLQIEIKVLKNNYEVLKEENRVLRDEIDRLKDPS